MLSARLRLGLLGAVCCFVSAAPVRVECALPLPDALGLPSVLPFRVVGPRSWASSLSWSVPFGVLAVVCATTPIPTIACLCNTQETRGARGLVP